MMVDLNGPWRWIETPREADVMEHGTHFIRDRDDVVIAKVWAAERARAIAELPDLIAKLEKIGALARPLLVAAGRDPRGVERLLALLREIAEPPRAQPEPADYWDVTP